MNILFICKHNVFRSKVAESYFNKINKNKNINIKSSGLVIGKGLSKKQKLTVKLQRQAAKESGILIKYNPKPSTIGLFHKQDLIIITANNISLDLIKNSNYVKKVIKWNIPDVDYPDKKDMKKTIKTIKFNTKRLVKKLEYKE